MKKEIKKEIESFRLESAPDMSDISGKRVRGYFRISSKAVGNDEARQMQSYLDFCKKYGVDDSKTYLERASGKGGVTRKKYHDMERDAKANKFDILWVEQPSRLGRNVLVGLQNMRDLEKYNVKVYLQKFNKIFDPKNALDKQMLILMLMVAEIEHDWNSDNTKRSMKTKQRKLKAWAQENGLININSGGGKSWNKMIIDDPLYKGDENKKGICSVEVPHMVEMLVQKHMLGVSNSALIEMFRQPVNHKCQYECWNGKEFPWGSMPRMHKSKVDGSRRLYRTETAIFVDRGGWADYIRSDEEVKKTHPEAFMTKKGPVKKRTCCCGQKMSKPTMSLKIKEHCYDTGVEEHRHPTAFKRAMADSTEISNEDLEELLASGKVSSK